MNPEQVNTAATAMGSLAAFLPWPSVAFTGPRETAGASQRCCRVGRLGQASPDRGR